jgi:hypothetical protein
MPYNVTTAFAQATSSGTITGVVSDPSGAVVPGATVTITDATTKSKRTTLTNKNGQYVLPNVPAGTYDVTAAKAGFSMDMISALPVTIGTQVTANFKMAVGAENTTVTVQASGADLQTMNASTAETVDPAMVDALPAVNRDASQFAAFQPGVTPGGNVAGTVQDQSVFQLDGGNNSSDMDGSMLSYTGSFGGSSTGGFLGASGSGVVPMPQDSVEEVRVATTGQTADFNNSTGMQASIATKRGRDRWTGTLYEYYLDSNIGANSWQNNFPTQTYCGYNNSAPTATGSSISSYCQNPLPAGVTAGTPTTGLGGSNGYTAKASYHFSRFGAAAGGPIAPTFLGGKTYLFVNYEGFRYPAAATFERAVPSANFLAGNLKNVSSGTNFTAAQLKSADPRGIGQNATLLAFYQKFLPNPNTPTAYTGAFDPSCTLVSSAYCDGINTIGFRANIAEAQSSNFFVARLDHDFGAKWHFNTSFRYYKFENQTGNQVDIGGQFAGDVLGTPKAIAPRPQQPIYLVAGLTTNISNSLTNDFHVSFVRNFWQWKNSGDAPQVAGWGGAIEPGGEGGSITGTLVPTNVNAQSTRTRIWDGQDTFFSDNVTKLKGDHIIQAGGQFQHNFNYHQRTDNGNAINYSTTYQIGDSAGAGTDTFPGLNGNGVSTSNSVFARVLADYYGFVTDTQGANTYTNNNGTLNINPALTPIYAKTKVDYYNVYASDTWRAKPGLTINYGLSYAIETPPYETNGNQVMFTDYYGNAIQVSKFLDNRKAQALAGNVFNNVGTQTNGINPEVGTSLVRNTVQGPGGGKYPYNPFYGALSPRLSAAWSPKFKSPTLAKMFGDSATVIRAGYGRIYGRINGVIQVLNPLLSPGLILATQCRYAQTNGQCQQPGFNDTTQFRFGTDGTTAPFAAAPAVLMTPNAPVYHPGYDGPGVAIGSPLDPTYKPNDVDTFNFSIQRQINRKMLVEVGYIGRLIHHELETLDPNAVPYQLTLGNQSFQSAYLALESAFGCTTSAGLCSKTASKAGDIGVAGSTAVNPAVPVQPFFETALGGATSAYCTTNSKGLTYNYGSCTAAVVAKQSSNIGQQKVFGLYSALDNNNNGSAASPGFVFNRTMMGTPTSNATYGSAGQFGTGLSIGTATGYGNYNGAYVSFKVSDFHGLTLQENMTYSKALGLDDSAQSSSGLIASDSFDLRKSYGRQGYDQKVIFNTFIVYQSPYFKQQNGIIGRIAGGWTVSPVLTAGTGQPLSCGTLSGGQAFGGTDGSNFGDNENCVFTTPYTGGYHTHRGVVGGADSNGNSIGTSVHVGGSAAAVNMFNNPVAVYGTVRAPILGLDELNSGNGPISGLGYLNIDLSIKKKLVVYKKYSLELTGVSTNVMNHLDFASPSLSLASATSFGVTKSQGNSPRQIQMGVRAYF